MSNKNKDLSESKNNLKNDTKASLEDESVSNERNPYFDDDLEFLSGEDTTIFASNDTGIFKQEEGVISWEIINLYKDSGDARGKYSLKSQPPILRVSTNDGESVDFMMTKEFTQTLNSALTDANRAFYGVQPASTKKTSKEKIEGYRDWIKENKVKSVILGLVLLSLIVLAFI